ncbi:metal-dependent hydrolase [Halorussus halophilus]|uniref:metal-dependent hydrolase n=1 Tax=Halorussus halophilus TaxID=2650975 RepID=UPI001CE3CA2D|nr:metal-dependent hydrolase [Halorussus halophilus]
MMATTHALFGMLLGAVALLVAPEYATVAIAAGAFGGLFPDFDMPWDHRKTLHFPVYFSIAASVALVGAIVAPSAVTIAVTAFLLAAAAHAASDALGGGLELRPWQGTSDRAVYDHFNGRWVAPRRWVPYDGAPEDLLLAAVLAVPGVLYARPLQAFVLVLLGVSVVYAVLRKRLVTFGERLVEWLPERVWARIPLSV